MSLLFIANYFESLLPDERPYEGTVLDDDGVTTVADIDANGNGSLAVTEPPTREKYRFDRSGERLVTEDSVLWSGSWSYTDYDYNFRQHFTSEVSIDGESSRLVEEGSGSWVGFYSHRWETTVDVMGQQGRGYNRHADRRAKIEDKRYTGRRNEMLIRDESGAGCVVEIESRTRESRGKNRQEKPMQQPINS